jgi:hypothetical protein
MLRNLAKNGKNPRPVNRVRFTAVLIQIYRKSHSKFRHPKTHLNSKGVTYLSLYAKRQQRKGFLPNYRIAVG